MNAEGHFKPVILMVCAVLLAGTAVIGIKRIKEGERYEAFLAASLAQGGH